jgi:hypothetical protein
MRWLIIMIGILYLSFSFASTSWVDDDLRYQELTNPRKATIIQIGEEMTAWRDSETIVVNIPGAYIDTLNGSPGRPLTLQLAAMALIKTCNTSVDTADKAIDELYRGAKDVRQGSGDIFKEYSFELRSGRYISVFAYLNDVSGIVAVIKTPRDFRSK